MKQLMALVLLMSLAFLTTFLITRPDLPAMLSGLWPQVPAAPEGAWLTVMALVGTTVVPNRELRPKKSSKGSRLRRHGRSRRFVRPHASTVSTRRWSIGATSTLGSYGIHRLRDSGPPLSLPMGTRT